MYIFLQIRGVENGIKPARASTHCPSVEVRRRGGGGIVVFGDILGA